MFSARLKINSIDRNDDEGYVNLTAVLDEPDHLVLGELHVEMRLKLGVGVEVPQAGDAITVNGWFSEQAPDGLNVPVAQTSVRPAEVRQAEADRNALGRCPYCTNVLDALSSEPCPSCENADKLCMYCDFCIECGAHLTRDNRGQVTGFDPPPEVEPVEETG